MSDPTRETPDPPTPAAPSEGRGVYAREDERGRWVVLEMKADDLILALQEAVRSAIGRMAPEQRVEFFGSFRQGYCPHCGREQGRTECQRRNDE